VIIFWIFALFVGATTFAFFDIFMQAGIVGSLLWALFAFLLTRGVLSIVRRWLIVRESITPQTDVLQRTVETNRAIFWRRVLYVMAIPVLYFAAMYMIFGFGPEDAIAVIPTVLQGFFTNLLYVIFLIIAQFSIFFLPFYIYTRIGKTMINPDDANFGVSIDDVRGQPAAVGEMKKILRLIEHGRLYTKAGGKRERGVLMVGPPGTGKTMLAKAIASSLHVPISIANGGSFAGMFLGIDALSVYLMVRAARKRAKTWGGCIIFIDEIDALGNRRAGMGGAMMGGMMMGGGSSLGLNMLLVLMDGIDNPGFFIRQARAFVNLLLDGLFIPRKVGANGSTVNLRIPPLKAPNYNLLFIGATNRPSVMDEALMRPGRFGRQIVFLMPKREARKDIAELYFGKKKHDPALDTPARREEFARITEGKSPADIEQVLSLALLYAFEDGRPAFEWRDVREALGNVEAGLPIPAKFSEIDRVRIARHEVGHALASHVFKKDHGHVRLSVRRRADVDGEIGGYHLAIPTEEMFNKFRSQHAADVRHSLGAMACERVFYGENSDGVSADLRMATHTACIMAGIVGMGADELDLKQSGKAADIGEHIISVAQVTVGPQHEMQTLEGAVLSNPRARRTVAQILGAAYIDDWRLMYVNKEGIDLAAEALLNAGGELVGDEITGLLDSINIRMPTAADPYPEDVAEVPDHPISISEIA